jgi:putative redox protein
MFKMITADSTNQNFKTIFHNASETAISDTTSDKGGGDSGFRPHELLEAALANCMNITLRMAAEKHGIPLESVSVSVTLDRSEQTLSTFNYDIDLQGPISEKDRQTLLSAVENCPVRKTLSKEIHFKSVHS